MSGKLELEHRDQGTRHVLRRRPVENGDILELLLDDMTWVRGRYRWSGDESEPPQLCFALPGEGDPEAVAVLPPQAILRWPDRTDEHRRLRDRAPTVCGADGD